ncbi:MAG: esterase [Flavobacteriaceae bacterium]
MKNSEHQVSYRTTNTYSTLNDLTPATENVWVVFHGIGYLSRYFIRYFDSLPTSANYIIAPQAPSKYYLNHDYRNVGASWLTKENTVVETRNDLAYLEAVMEQENIPGRCRLIVLGFSQGVSIAMRWLAQRKLSCHHLVLFAGGIPNELQASDFAFLMEAKGKITSVVGDSDEFFTPERRNGEMEKLQRLFHGKAKSVVFKGGHTMCKELLSTLI